MKIKVNKQKKFSRTNWKEWKEGELMEEEARNPEERRVSLWWEGSPHPSPGAP